MKIKIYSKENFAVPLSDEEVVNQYPQFVDRLAPWRKLAISLDYYGPVAWLVKDDFSLTLSGFVIWFFKHNKVIEDTVASNTLVFWVPRLAPDSTNKIVAQMEQYRGELRTRYNLPENHCDRFGSIALLAALIMAHFKRTGKLALSNNFFVVSDSFDECDWHFFCGFYDPNSIDIEIWPKLNCSSDGIGFFLLGVEEI